jgi:hypothetical protein
MQCLFALSITGRVTAAKQNRAVVSRFVFRLRLALLDFVEQGVKFCTEIRQLV